MLCGSIFGRHWAYGIDYRGANWNASILIRILFFLSKVLSNAVLVDFRETLF